MNKKIFIAATFIAACVAFFTQCTQNQADTPKATVPSEADLVKKGEYLVGILGCQDCHSPKKLGPNGPEVIPELHLSGYPSDRPVPKVTPQVFQDGWILFGADGTAAAGPWGISFAGNLTSDDTGIGTWSYEQFKKALTQGKFKGLEGGRMLLPPMPWMNYVNIKEEDLQAIYKYLKSTKPVKNVAPAPVPPAG